MLINLCADSVAVRHGLAHFCADFQIMMIPYALCSVYESVGEVLKVTMATSKRYDQQSEGPGVNIIPLDTRLLHAHTRDTKDSNRDLIRLR